MGCVGGIARCLLFIFNFAFFLAGAALLGVGIWMKVDDSIVDYIQIISPNDSLFSTAATIFIAVGGFIFVVGFLGCCGAIKESSCMLCLYSFLIVVAVLLQIGAVIICIVFMSTVKGVLSKEMQRQVTLEFGKVDSVLTVAWNRLQNKQTCCGVDSALDYANSHYANTTTNSIPPTCCKLKGGTDFENPEAADYDACKENYVDMEEEDYTGGGELHFQGCLDALNSFLNDKSTILIATGLGFILIEIVLICTACCLRRSAKT